MVLDQGTASAAVGCGPRRRLRLALGLRLLSAVENRHRHGASRGAARRLPSVRALAVAAGVHRNTVAAVYHDLERFGLVRCVHGAGTFAMESPAHSWTQPGEAVCSDSGLAEVLAAELRRPVRVAIAGGPPEDRRFVPIDESPPPDGVVIPVAPLGRALRALRHLPPDSTVSLLSASPRLGRLVRHTIVALHGDAVGLARTQDEYAVSGLGTDLALVDLRQLERRGTYVSSEGLIPLRLLVRSGREAG